ncbi:MAG TPA: hypothetical protein VF160_13815 [Candidatus Dormibacteraeota bacterium]
MNSRLLFLLPAAWLLSVGAAPSPTATATTTASPAATPTPTPVPTPTPSVGQVSLDPTLGPPGGKITVSGSAFRPGEQVNLFWDSPDKGLGAATADAQGSFKVDVAAQGGDPGTSHTVCADEKNPGPRCANFVLTAAPTPTPSALPTPQQTPLPSSAPTPAPTVAPVPESRPVSAVSVLLEPPFVFFPLLLVLAALGGAGFWIWSGNRTPRPAPVPAARVVHRSAHPAGTDPDPLPPPAAESTVPTPSAPRRDLPASGEVAPLRPMAGDDPLDLPEPGD